MARAPTASIALQPALCSTCRHGWRKALRLALHKQAWQGLRRTCLPEYLPLPGPQLGVAKDIIAKDGFGSLYKGLTAGLLRQATYTTARLGIFQVGQVGRGGSAKAK